MKTNKFNAIDIHLRILCRWFMSQSLKFTFQHYNACFHDTIIIV